MSYKEFIESKYLKAEKSGFEAKELNPILFDFQKDLTKWALRLGKSAIFASTGLGKTFMQLEWAREVFEFTKKPVLILAPLAVSSQTVEEAKKLNVSLKYCKEQSEIQQGINITNYERLDNFNPNEFMGIVLDECFAPDTKIQIIRDDCLRVVNIKDCKINDFVLNCNGIDRINAIKKKEVKYAIKIGYNGKETICSPRHPFFTQRGWVCAKEIQKNDFIISTDKAMRILRGEFSDNIQIGISEEILRKVLLCEMENEPTAILSKSSYEGNSSKNREKEIRMVQNTSCKKRIRKNKKIKSNEQFGNTQESIIEIESDGTPTFSAWGEWSRNDITSAINEGCIVRELDSGICYINGKATGGLSDKLQSRLSQLRNENCDRDRWELSLFEKKDRREKGQKTGYFGVESFEVLELGYPELDKYRDEQGKLYFYDLEIERHPSFTINGCLVHNSSILKSFTGKYRQQIIDNFRYTPYKLACSATPAPNDYMELGNHAEFLNQMSRTEMLSMFFYHDGGDTSKWRLKGHAEDRFWEWVSSWAAIVKNPEDLGYDGSKHKLPPLVEKQIMVETEQENLETLFAMPAKTMDERRGARKNSLNERCQKVCDLVTKKPNEQWLIWCDLNDEANLLKKLIPDSINVQGGDKPEEKAENLLKFGRGEIKYLITKPKIASFGLNWQTCHNIIFAGLSDSYEMTYQAIRRCWRFGQKHQVNVFYITSIQEQNVLKNIQRKQKDFENMQNSMVGFTKKYVRDNLEVTFKELDKSYKPKVEMIIPEWVREEV